MDCNSAFTGHIEQVRRNNDSAIDAMELRSSTVHQKEVTPRQDHVDEEVRSRQPLSFSPQVSHVRDPLETSASRELLPNKMNNQVLASVACMKMHIPLSCAITDVTPEAIKKIATDYMNGRGHAIPDTPLARVVSTSIAKVVLSIPLRDLYLHDGHSSQLPLSHLLLSMVSTCEGHMAYFKTIYCWIILWSRCAFSILRPG